MNLLAKQSGFGQNRKLKMAKAAGYMKNMSP